MPAPPVDEDVVAGWFRYARTVTGDDALAAEAVRDTLVLVARDTLAPATPLAGWALLRNEALRQLRARSRFVDVREALDLQGLPAPASGEALWRAALSALSPGDRDSLAISAAGLTEPDAARVMGVTPARCRARTAAARGAWAGAAGAASAVVATADEPPSCAEVLALLARDRPGGHAPADDVVTVTPGGVDRIARHVERCRICRDRRRLDLGDDDPTAVLAAMPVAPGDLSDRATGILVHDLERADRIVARAGARDADGLPVPLDAADRVPAAWARRAALLAALSALLLLTAVLLYVVTA